MMTYFALDYYESSECGYGTEKLRLFVSACFTLGYLLIENVFYRSFRNLAGVTRMLGVVTGMYYYFIRFDFIF